MAFLADGELAEQALNHASPLDREHKRLKSGLIDQEAFARHVLGRGMIGENSTPGCQGSVVGHSLVDRGALNRALQVVTFGFGYRS